MTGLASGSEDRIKLGRFWNKYLDADQTTAYTNFTPPVSREFMSLWRDVSLDDVETQKLDLMPGFKFTWWYSGAEVTPDNRYKDEEMTKQFVR